MLWLITGGVTLLYILLWPFSLRLDARLSPTSGRAEVAMATFFRLRLEGDFLQPPYLSLFRLDAQGRRQALTRKKKKQKRKDAFTPVIRGRRLSATLYVGMEGDGAMTVEALGLLYAFLETVGRSLRVDISLRPAACFDKSVCVLRLSGIGRVVLAQNILEYLKGKH